MTSTEEAPAVTPGPPLIYAAMSAVMSDMDSVGKTGVNREQGYKFRSIEDVLAAAHTALVKHGVFYLPTVLTRIPEERRTNNGKPVNVVHLEMRYDFYAADGSSVQAVVWGEGADMADKATNKAMSQALKYNLVQALCISAGDIADADQSAEEAGPSRRPRDESWRDQPPVNRAAARPNGQHPKPDEPPAAEPETDVDWMTHLVDDLIPAATTRDELTALWADVAAHKKAGTCTEENAAQIGAVIRERNDELTGAPA
jgi:hypothetical protein